jgi:uncharacterized membrane protein SirB2
MDAYTGLKHLHMTLVAISGLFFLVRGGWLLQAPEKLQAKWVRISPHVIDTFLLLSGIGMLAVSHTFPPFVHVKLALLVVYIGLGVMAFRKAKTAGQKAGFLLAAVAVFLFMVSVAVTKSPLGVFA